jgi:hypothetical protein
MHSFDALYDLDLLNYTKAPSANNAQNQKAGINYNYKGPEGISGKAGNVYVNTTDPAFTESAKREHRWFNAANLSGEYNPQGGPFVGGVYLDTTKHKYLDYASDSVNVLSLGEQLDRIEQNVMLKGGYKVLPKTRVYLDYRRNIIHYASSDNPKNNKSHNFDAGIEGVIAPKLTGQIQTGFTYRKYDNDFVNNFTGSERTNIVITRNWTVGTNLRYNPIERCEATFAYNRALQEATFTGNRFYVSNALNFGFKHKFPYKLTGGLDFGFVYDKYPEVPEDGNGAVDARGGRRDDIYTQGLSVGYDVQQYLNLSLGYTHRQKFSTWSGQYNYNDHVTALTAKVMF